MSEVPLPQRGIERPHGALNSRDLLLLAGVLALSLLTFGFTFTFGWVYDDAPQIVQNPELRWDRVGSLFTHHLWASAGTAASEAGARFYRPLLSVWFLINNSVFGLNPHWFHVTTVLAHLLATALAFFIAYQVLNDVSAALFSAGIFGVHPMQAESVSWISAVNDSLAAIFCFATFLCYRRAIHARSRGVIWWVLFPVFFLCALLMKEVSIVLPAIVLVDLWAARKREPSSKSAPQLAALVLGVYGSLATVFLIVRLRVLGHVAGAISNRSWTSVLLTAPKILLFQFWHVVFPAGLSPHYDVRALGAAALPGALLALCGVLVFLGFALFLLRKGPSLAVAFAWLLFPLLPSLNLRWLNEDDFVHDRYLYMSMLGAALLGGAAFAALKRHWSDQRLIAGLALALVIGLGFASAIQSQFWSNDIALFSRAVQIAPQNEWAQLNYGAALTARGKNAEAAPHFVKSYELKPGWKSADYAGFAFQNSGDPTQAEHWYTVALRYNPSLADAWFALGEIRLTQHRATDAIPLLQKAIALAPAAEGYHYALGLAFEQTSQRAAAEDAYRTELRLHPSQSGVRRALEALGEKP